MKSAGALLFRVVMAIVRPVSLISECEEHESLEEPSSSFQQSGNNNRGEVQKRGQSR